jgi:hypothetical protein
MAPADLVGEVVAVTVTEIGSNSLFGTLAGRAAAWPSAAALAEA